MAIENFDEIKTYFDTNKDSEDVKNFLNGFTNVDVFKEKINTDPNFKSFMDSEKDKHSAKALETWKTNNLQKLIDEGISKANPQETPEQKRIRELEDRLNKQETESKRKELINLALKTTQEKKLPTELVDYFIGDSEETTIKNLEALEKVFNEKVNQVAEERLKGGYKPPQGEKNTATNNPWSKEHFNLTEQGKLLRESPELAKKYIAEARK